MDDQWKVLISLLEQIARQKKITQEIIAEKTGLQRSNVSRIFALKYCPDLRNFMKIAKAIDVNFFFEDKESKTDSNLAMEQAMEQLGRRVNKLSKN